MRIKLVISGLVFVLISIPGYLYTPTLMSQMLHSFMSSMTGSAFVTHGSILHQMGYPSRTVIIPLIQYSFLGLAIAGLGLMVFGGIAKKITSQVNVKQVTAKQVSEEIEETKKVKERYANLQFKDERKQTNLHSLRILQERLANGEITASEFRNLKRLLD